MGLLVASKNEEDPIKNEGARVVTTLFINFSDTQANSEDSDGILPKIQTHSSLNGCSCYLQE